MAETADCTGMAGSHADSEHSEQPDTQHDTEGNSENPPGDRQQEPTEDDHDNQHQKAAK